MPDPLQSRPRLLVGILLGVLIGAALFLIPNTMRATTRVILAWDAGCGVFIGAVMLWMRGCTQAQMKTRAKTQDEGAGAILAMTLLAAAASIAAIVMELSEAKGDHGLLGQLRIALAFGTVALSWLFVQTIFALHYAHVYYSPDGKKAGAIQGGLGFPGGQAPDYWDFLHFSLVIGVASQTADVTFTAKDLRRVGTLHSVVAFVFNTVVLALTINLAASLF